MGTKMDKNASHDDKPAVGFNIMVEMSSFCSLQMPQTKQQKLVRQTRCGVWQVSTIIK